MLGVFTSEFLGRKRARLLVIPVLAADAVRVFLGSATDVCSAGAVSLLSLGVLMGLDVERGLLLVWCETALFFSTRSGIERLDAASARSNWGIKLVLFSDVRDATCEFGCWFVGVGWLVS